VRQASANGHLSNASLQIEWRSDMNVSQASEPAKS